MPYLALSSYYLVAAAKQHAHRIKGHVNGAFSLGSETLASLDNNRRAFEDFARAAVLIKRVRPSSTCCLLALQPTSVIIQRCI